MSATTMACMSCGKVKAYPDAFPNRTFAECWQCAWEAHTRAEHPKVIRDILRTAKKRARRLKQTEIEAALIGGERSLVLGNRPTATDTSPSDGAREGGTK